MVLLIVGISVLVGVIVGIIIIIKKCKEEKMKMGNNSNITDQQPNDDSYKSDVNMDKDE